VPTDRRPKRSLPSIMDPSSLEPDMSKLNEYLQAEKTNSINVESLYGDLQRRFTVRSSHAAPRGTLSAERLCLLSAASEGRVGPHRGGAADDAPRVESRAVVSADVRTHMRAAPALTLGRHPPDALSLSRAHARTA
jgi:hypothetical protein